MLQLMGWRPVQAVRPESFNLPMRRTLASPARTVLFQRMLVRSRVSSAQQGRWRILKGPHACHVRRGRSQKLETPLAETAWLANIALSTLRVTRLAQSAKVGSIPLRTMLSTVTCAVLENFRLSFLVRQPL